MLPKHLITPRDDITPHSHQRLARYWCGDDDHLLSYLHHLDNYGEASFLESLDCQTGANTMSSPSSMKAVHYEKPFQVSVREIPVPKIEHPDDVIIKVTTAGMLRAMTNRDGDG